MRDDFPGEELQLDDILDLSELEKLFSHFSVVAGLDAALFDPAGRKILANRRDHSICALAGDSETCRSHLAAGGRMAAELGEPYIFTCGCGLVMCSSPVMFDERLIGIIACGPAVLWDVDDVAVTELGGKIKDMPSGINPEQILKGAPSYECSAMTSAAQLFFVMTTSLTRRHSRYLQQRAQITEQQARISSMVIERKIEAANIATIEKHTFASSYPVETEKELIAFVQSGNKQRATAQLNDILGVIFSMAGGDLDTIRVKLFELIAFLSRAAVDAGAPLKEINAITKASFEICEDNTDFEQLCFLTTRALEGFIETVYRNRERKQTSLHLTRAIEYIMTHYMEDISLGTVASGVYVSEYYLSHLFRREINKTFSDYVSDVRISRALEILRDDSSAQIQEVADKTGFSDPNYFARIFKKHTGVSPREYQALFR
jgi:two-component system response regulator YesN